MWMKWVGPVYLSFGLAFPFGFYFIYSFGSVDDKSDDYFLT